MVRFLQLSFLLICFYPLLGCSEDKAGEKPSAEVASEAVEEKLSAKSNTSIDDGFIRKPLKILTQDGRTLFFQVEVADTPEEAAKGFMFREELASDHGMIFIFPDTAPRRFWMQNTFLALDIIFLDAEGRVINVGYGKPLDESGVYSEAPSRAAIEFNRGTAEKMNIQPGDQVYFAGLFE